MAQRNTIFLEFNELCPWLLEKWMGEGKLPNFKRLYEQSQVYTTLADVEDPAHLEPWIQWYSMHTGLPFSEHKVFHLTDGPKAGHKNVWDRLRERGVSAGNFSSMNAPGFQSEDAFYLPDPWCASETPHPAELQDFYRVVSFQVREYTNREQGLSKGDYFGFLKFLMLHGLRLKTILAIMGQLAGEVFSGKKTSWKRVPLLDKLQFDVFRHYWRKKKPRYSSFFVNSTAHYQHAYWRQFQPEAFEVKPSPEDVAQYGGAIEFGYTEMDKLIGDFLALCKEGATLAFATALSQQPFLKYEAKGGQIFYRPRKIENLLRAAGVEFQSVSPVMTHQFQAKFASPEAAQAARAKLAAVKVGDTEIFDFMDAGPGALYFGASVQEKQAENAKMKFADGGEAPFADHFYLIDARKSGRHHPEGALWFQTGTHAVHKERVSILDVLPTILAQFGIAPPDDRPGKAIDVRMLEKETADRAVPQHAS